MHIGGGYLRFRKQFLDELPIKNFESLIDNFTELCNKEMEIHLSLISMHNNLFNC